MMSSAMSAGSASRPQARWRSEVNNSDQPFVPKLRSKPNAIVPLQLVLTTASEEVPGSMVINAGTTVPHYSNPYEHEIAAFEPNEMQLTPPAAERMYLPLHLTPCHWVDTEDALQELRTRLNGTSEFAIDLEAHSYRSYRGFVCLMQISTREEDFLVDTLELRTSLHILNESFTNPRITKVLHGGDSDILWLQRDFGLYVVGAFDTGQAARVLEMPSFSLAHLLKVYCGIIANKTYQMADWRIRPLTEEMVSYARQDTHYLLFIHDKLKHELHAKQRTSAVWQRSAELCRQAYFVVPLSDDDHKALLRRQNAEQLRPQQINAHRALFRWRDALAREEDESCSYVLPNHLLLKLAQALPHTTEQLSMICHPLPPLLNYHSASLLATIAASVNGADVRTENAPLAAEPSIMLPPAASAPVVRMGALGIDHSEGAFKGMQLSCGMSSQSWTPQLHPMQPSLQMSPAVAVQQSHQRGRQASPQRRTSTADGGARHNSVRRPPSPSRSPPLDVDALYEAAGWVSQGAGELASVLMKSGNTKSSMAVPSGSREGGGLFDGWSTGSSSEEDDDAAVAQGIQAQLNISPLWILDMFAPPSRQDDSSSAKDGRPGRNDAGEGQGRLSAPRSLNEIYKLSNLNKRRGAMSACKADLGALPGAADVEHSDSDDPNEDGCEEKSGEEGGDEGETVMLKRRKGGETGISDGISSTKENTEDFMRRIGWLQPDASLSMLSGDKVDRGPPGGAARSSGHERAHGMEPAGVGEAPMDLLPYQRQQMMAGVRHPMGLPAHMSVTQPPSSVYQHVAQQPGSMPMPPQQKPLIGGRMPGSMPNPMGRHPQLPQSHGEQNRTKGSGKSRHKKRTGFAADNGSEAPVPSSAFVYNMNVMPQAGGKGGKGAGGGKGGGFGGRGGGNKHGGSGGRSMIFTSSGGRRH